MKLNCWYLVGVGSEKEDQPVWAKPNVSFVDCRLLQRKASLGYFSRQKSRNLVTIDIESCNFFQ